MRKGGPRQLRAEASDRWPARPGAAREVSGRRRPLRGPRAGPVGALRFGSTATGARGSPAARLGVVDREVLASMAFSNAHSAVPVQLQPPGEIRSGGLRHLLKKSWVLWNLRARREKGLETVAEQTPRIAPSASTGNLSSLLHRSVPVDHAWRTFPLGPWGQRNLRRPRGVWLDIAENRRAGITRTILLERFWRGSREAGEGMGAWASIRCGKANHLQAVLLPKRRPNSIGCIKSLSPRDAACRRSRHWR